jgi:sodium transport system permease protein
MNIILTIFRKEIKTTLRDRRTLISAVVIPALAMPLILLGVTKLTKRLTDKEANKQLSIAMIGAPPAIENQFSDTKKFRIIRQVPLAAARDSVAAENYDAVLAFDDHFASSVDSLGTGNVSFYYKSTNIMVESRVKQQLEQYKAQEMARRFERLHLAQNLLTPVAITPVDVASQKEQIGMLAGGFLPYIFIIFCFVGCMYPALDLITGEKEKGTIETLLTVPASRFQILLAKMLTIATIGVCAAVMTITGMFVALRMMHEIPQEILTTINDILSLRFVLMLFLMLIPLSLCFAGLLSAVVIRANSFKEAQTYVTPMTFAVIIPAIIALTPGMKLSWQTVWIPILNIALATKEIIAGTIHYAQYAAIVLSLIAVALLALTISVRQFSKEGNILK